MGKNDRHDPPITADRFMHQFMRLKRGSISRRQFFGITGLGLATSILGASTRTFTPPARAGDLGGSLLLATWPNYHSPKTFEAFTRATGVKVRLQVYGSNEKLLSDLRGGGAGWDLFVPTNYTIAKYVELGLLDELDLARLPNFSAATQNTRFLPQGQIDGRNYAVPKNWGTTGMAFNKTRIRRPPKSWKEFFDSAMTLASGHTIVHDNQLTAVGSALVALGLPFNSISADDLAKAERLLLEVKPHLYAIDSDYQPALRAGDAWLSMCWTNDAAQMMRDMPEIAYRLGGDGGEIWADFYAIPKDAPNKPAAYALLNFLMDPAVAVGEHLANGAPATDSRVITLLPKEIAGNKAVYPDDATLTPLEFGAAATLTDPGRLDLMARFRAA